MPPSTTAADGDHRADDRCHLPAVAQIGGHTIASFRNASEVEIFSVALKMKNRNLGRLQEFHAHTGGHTHVMAAASPFLTSPRDA